MHTNAYPILAASPCCLFSGTLTQQPALTEVAAKPVAPASTLQAKSEPEPAPDAEAPSQTRVRRRVEAGQAELKEQGAS